MAEKDVAGPQSPGGVGNRRATLKDVAQAVGVHVSTVSRALNPETRHLITPQIVEKIAEASRQLGYQPNTAAYSLRTNRTHARHAVEQLRAVGARIAGAVVNQSDVRASRHGGYGNYGGYAYRAHESKAQQPQEQLAETS